MVTPDLFDSPSESALTSYLRAFEAWASSSDETRGIGRETSVETYRVMWNSLIKWALAQNPVVTLECLTSADLERFLDKRRRHNSTAEELSPRYVWRLLNLVDRVLRQDAKGRQACANDAARQLLCTREEWQHANAAGKDPLPDYLTALQAKELVNYLAASLPRHGRRGADHTWQELRNRTMVAVQLGAGATPAEIRNLRVESVIVQGGPIKQLPWKLVHDAHGSAAGHESPIARWAGHILRHWLDLRESLSFPGQHLFPSTRTGKPIGKVAQYLAVCQTMELSGLEKALVSGGSFRLRHTFALRQLRRGHTEEQVARWMGVEAAEMVRYRKLIFAPVSDVV